jgi:hypothetical protein
MLTLKIEAGNVTSFSFFSLFFIFTRVSTGSFLPRIIYSDAGWQKRWNNDL